VGGSLGGQETGSADAGSQGDQKIKEVTLFVHREVRITEAIRVHQGVKRTDPELTWVGAREARAEVRPRMIA
jgi:hypothetical protein